MRALRVAIVEDQTIFRELLAEMLGGDDRYEVVAQLALGADALALLLDQPPDLLLLDVVLPDMSGLDVLARAAGKLKRTRTLLITASERPAVIQQALQQRVHGIVTKGTPLRELRVAIDEVASGGTYYCPTAARIVREVAGRPVALALTTREREIVGLVAAGLSSKEIASRLGLSVKTVSNHRLRAMERIGVRNAAELTHYAIEQGLIHGRR